MYRLHVSASSGMHQVEVELVCIERSKRSKQTSHRLKTGIKCLIGAKLILINFLTPEALTVEAYIPVTEVAVNEVIYKTTGACRVIVHQLTVNISDKGVQL